jgi:hypothetical protein
MSKLTLKLSTAGLSIRDEILVKSLLTIIESKTNAAWVFSELGDAVICDPQTPEGQQAVKQYKNFGKPVCIYFGEEEQSQPDSLFLKPPIRVMSVIFALNWASKHLEDKGLIATNPQVSAVKASAIAAENQVSPQDLHPLSLRLYELQKQPQHAFEIAAPDGTRLGLSFSKRCYWFEGDLQRIWDATASGLLQTLKLSEEDVDRILQSRQVGNIEKLWWKAGLKASDGEILLPNLQRQSEYRLKRWPDVSAISVDPAFMRLAGLLTKRAWTITVLHEQTQIPVAKIISFFNASEMSGFLKQAQELSPPKPVETLPATTNTSLFSRLRSRLGI